MDTTVHPPMAANRDHGFSEMMSLALDGLLSAEESESLNRHLAACPACQAQWNKWQRISHILQVEPFAGPAQGFVPRVDQTLQRAEQRKEHILGGMVLAGGTATILAIVALGTALALAWWMTNSPAARLLAAEFLGFTAQLATLIWQNVTTLRDSALALAPDPRMVLLIMAGLMAAGVLWVRLVFYRSSARADGHGQAGRES